VGGRVLTLDRALDRLLHRRADLAAFLAGGAAHLDVSPEDLATLRTADPAQLERTAARIRRDLLARRHRGSSTLAELYPRTVDAWRAANPDCADLTALADAFLESPSGDAYRELDRSGSALSLEEAFYRFAEERALGEGKAREAEFLAAMVRALVTTPSPGFALPRELRRCPGGVFAVSTRATTPALFAAVDGRVLQGAITPFLAELLVADDPPAELAARHGVDAAVLSASLAQLRALRLHA
jgi:hypothetical protein